MKKVIVIVILAVATPAFANMVVNGDFSNGENGWTRWRATWGTTENWDASTGVGNLYGGGGNGSFGWFQVVPTWVSEFVKVDAMWTGDIGGSGWAEVMLFSVPVGTSDADIANRLDTGAAADIAFKKDSWGMNPPTAWDWQAASLSPHPSGNGGVIHNTEGWIVVGTKLGGFPLGTVNFDNIVLTPEPAAMLLLGLPLLLVRRRRA
ncbi:MAG: hypothetical protein QUV05_00015 [Phycisphaerae bacterium]|nr:hypothetical protein [Phycisphaerae bacterium]